MPTLTIDNHTVTVAPGSNVLQAAQALGIVIPHYCYHEALGAVGACRFCAMSFLEGPIRGLRMSCLIEAQDGMVVSTLDPVSQEMRRSVTEWLMINHPHDCPVCDEGGECQLQDMTVAGGHSIRRYRGRKRTFYNQDLGPFIQHEMNRCIQCYRCVRTYRDYCGGGDFGVLGVNQRVYFGRFREGRLQSPFSGNLVDVCPTGVFTDKPFRFKARPWDLQEAPSICPHCSLGCALIPGAYHRALQRVRAGVNRETNGFFICDRGRFGYGYANHPERPRVPIVDRREVSWDQALSFVRERIAALVRVHGEGSIAFLGSPRASLEANGALLLWSRELRSDRLCFECHPRRDRAARAYAAGLGERARSLQEIRSSDFVLAFGLDPLAEGPLMALAIRQAARAGGVVAVLDPRPVMLPTAFEHLPLQPEKLSEALAAIGGGLLRSFTPAEADVLKSLRKRLQEARRPVLLGGVDLLGPEGVARLLQTAASLSNPERPCGAAIMLTGPNSFGGALLAEAGPDFDELLTGIENGKITALVCLQADPISDHHEHSRVASALAKLELLVVLDCIPSSTGGSSTVFLPTTVTAEEDGTFVSHEGRMQRYAGAFSPGLPIRITGGGGHPPRTFFQVTPGSLPRPGWETLEVLAGRAPVLEDLRRRIEGYDGRFLGLVSLDAIGSGKRVAGAAPAVAPLSKPVGGSEGGLRLLVTESLFGSEVLSSFSQALQAVNPEPVAVLHAEDAAALGIAEGDRIKLSLPNGTFELRVRLSQRMARRLVVVPRVRRTVLEELVPGTAPVPCKLEKGASG